MDAMIPVSRSSVGQEELAAVSQVFATGWLGMGSATEEFEAAVRARLQCAHVVAVNTGTSALHLALVGFGIGPGDEVMVPSLTFAACVQAIIMTGAAPVFCDSREDTGLLDVEDVERRLTRRTRVIMPVHYAGQPCEMDRLLTLASRHGLVIVEDAAHAFGAHDNGRPIGSFGHATCFSFDPIKTPTCGEGGAIALADGAVADRLRRLRVLGIDRDAWKRLSSTQRWSYEVTMPGYRYHMPNFCAAIGLAQLRKLDGLLERRRAIARRYDSAFRSLQAVRPLATDRTQTSAFLYIVKVAARAREGFMEFLRARGVDTGVHFAPNHLQPFFRQFARGPLPRVERLSQEIVTLPLYATMRDDEVEAVMDVVRAFDQPHALAVTPVRP